MRARKAARVRRVFLRLLTLAALCGVAGAQPPAPNDGASCALLEHQFAVYFMRRFPVVATYLGGSGFDAALADIDGSLRDYSSSAIQEEDAQLARYQERFNAFPAEALSAAARIDRAVALAEIDFLLREHQVRRHQERSLDSYVDEPFRGIDWQIQGMTATEGQGYGTTAEWRAVLARTRAVASYLAQAQRQIATGVARGNTPDWRVLVEYGMRGTRSNAEYFAKTLPQIAMQRLIGGDRQALLPELHEAGRNAAAAYLRLRAYIRAAFFDRDGPAGTPVLKARYRTDHFAFGETEYDWALSHNFKLKTSASELFSESWPIVTDSRAAMVTLARAIAADHKWRVPAEGGDIVRRAFEELSRDAPGSDTQMLQWYRQTGVRLIDYARHTSLFEVPADYRLDVVVTPPPLRASIEGAAYYPAPIFKDSGVGRFYVSPTGNNPAELAHEHNRAALADLAAHEGFPGHDWHYKVMTLNKADISPVRWLTPGAVEDSSSMWQDSLAAEGWALYAEALLAEPQLAAPTGFYTPEEHLYQLRGKLYRDLRVRIDTGIHTGRMSFEQAVTLFSEVVDFLPGRCDNSAKPLSAAKRASCKAARAAVTRYSRWPTQAITYRLGKEQILALRQEAQDMLGAQFSPQRFHLEFMRQGTIPAAYFGAQLLLTLSNAPPQH